MRLLIFLTKHIQCVIVFFFVLATGLLSTAISWACLYSDRPPQTNCNLWIGFIAALVAGLLSVWQALCGYKLETIRLFKVVLWPVLIGLLGNFLWTVFELFKSDGSKSFTFLHLASHMCDQMWVFLIGALVTFIFNSWTSLHLWKTEFVMAQYRGLSRLVSDNNSARALEDLEVSMINVTQQKSILRGIVLEYILSSMQALGRNGYAIADCGVNQYVFFISELAKRSDRIATTCVMRPYWFVVDAIQGVVLPPFDRERDKCGKGEHLRSFEKNISGWGVQPKYQRCLIVDEVMIVEMFLTAEIDTSGVKAPKNNCPYCSNPTYLIDCPFHGKREKYNKSTKIDDIPEIMWFSKQVNRERCVDLIFTSVNSVWRASCEELEDRVFATNSNFSVDLRFSFTCLEKGTLRLYWETQARPLAFIDSFNVKINPVTGILDDKKGHKMYRTFSECLKNNALQQGMITHLDYLYNAVNAHFNATNVATLVATDADILRKYLCNGEKKMKDFLLDAINSLKGKLTINSSENIYKLFVEDYKIFRSAPVLSHVVVIDPIKPQHPIRIARWKKNWKGILNEVY